MPWIEPDCRRPGSVSMNRCKRFQRSPSGSRTGRFSNRCTSSSSTRSPCRLPVTTRPLVAPRSTAPYLGKVEDLLEAHQALVGTLAEERRHLLLPAIVDVGLRHRALRRLEVLGLDVADEQPVVAQEQRVVAPAGLAQRLLHLGPHVAVALLVLFEPLGVVPQQEADALHQLPTSAYSSPSSRATVRTSRATWPTPSATWWVGPSSHQRSRNSPGASPKRRRLFVLPIRNVSPGIDSPSAASSFRRPSSVWVQPTIVTGP